MSGQLSPSYLSQWQQDYSHFINTAYAPLAQQAIDNSAKALQATFGAGAKVETYPYMDKFIADRGGKLIREVSEEQYRAVNTLVRQATMSDTMNYNELAKAIRPTIGLTTRQSQATVNFYNQAIADGYTPEQALKMQARYAERIHRNRADTIAITEMAYAYNWGEQAYMEQCIQDGLIGSADKKWVTALDERVCDICGQMDGEIVGMDGIFSCGVQVPPAHPRCRCVISYINVTQPSNWTDQPQAQQTTPDPNDPSIPEDFDIDGLDYGGKLNIGGTGEMHLLTDPNDPNAEYIFKPAYKKGSTSVEEFRAYVQEAGYKVQNIVDPDSAIRVGVGEVDIPGKGKVFGAAQTKIGNINGAIDLQDWQFNGGTLDPDIVAQLQREQVTDWLLCNYDSHGRNFVVTNDGTVFGVDKEQAFRYLTNPKAQSLSYTFHPNAMYGETEPIYNTLYRRFANGEIDLKLNDTLTYIKRIEAIPDTEYREIFRKYAEALHGKGAKAEQLLDQIVLRKQNVRTTYETFYSDLLTQRKGTKTVFQFTDNAAAAMLTPPSPITSTFTPATLKGLKLADLQALAKAKGIKNFGILHKNELIDVISDPSKQQQIFQAALDRAHQQYAARRAGKTGQQPGSIPQLSNVLNDIDGALKGTTPRGVAVIADKTALEGLQANIRKITIDGEDYYELSGKLTEPQWQATLKQLQTQAQGSNWLFNRGAGDIDYSQPILHLTSNTEAFSINTRYIRNGDDIFVIVGDNAERDARALMGRFNIRVKASNGAQASLKFRDMMSRAGIDNIAEEATQEYIDRYKKMRLIWQNDPATAGGLKPDAPVKELDRILSQMGITQARIDKMQLKQVMPGYWTLYDPENVTLAKKYKAAYIYHEMTSEGAVTATLKSGELLATTNRWNRGIVNNGMSSSTDIRTGGAGSVFTRIVYDNQVGVNDKYGWGDYMFVFDTDVLARTDWYAYKYDSFGSTEKSYFNRRPGNESFFQATSTSYSRSNEVMFRETLPLDNLKEIRVNTDSQRTSLIQALRREGIITINGSPVEKIIKVFGGVSL